MGLIKIMPDGDEDLNDTLKRCMTLLDQKGGLDIVSIQKQVDFVPYYNQEANIWYTKKGAECEI